MRFEDILIKNVRMHPWLYDKSSKWYHNKPAKAEAWATIVAATGISEKDCQSRWRTLRDAYVRHLKAHELRQLHEGKIATKWPFYNALRFLKPFVQMQKKTYAFQHSSDEEDDAEDEETTEAPVEIKRMKFDDEECNSTQVSATPKEQFSSPDTDNNRDEDDEEKEVDDDDYFNASTQNYCEFNKKKRKSKRVAKQESSKQSTAVEPEQFKCMQMPVVDVDESTCDDDDENDDNDDDASQTSVQETPTRGKTRRASLNKATANARMYNKLEVALQTIGDYVTHKTSDEDEKSSNAAFLSILDEYLMQMTDDRRENMKMKILNSVYNKIRESQ